MLEQGRVVDEHAHVRGEIFELVHLAVRLRRHLPSIALLESIAKHEQRVAVRIGMVDCFPSVAHGDDRHPRDPVLFHLVLLQFVEADERLLWHLLPPPQQ